MKDKRYAGLAVTILGFVLAGCSADANPPEDLPGSQNNVNESPTAVAPLLDAAGPYSGNPIQPVNFGLDSSKQMSITNLQGHSVFLIKVNTSSQTVGYSSTGHAYTAEKSPNLRGLGEVSRSSRGFISLEGGVHRYDPPEVSRFNNNPPPFSPPSGEPARSGLNDGRVSPYSALASAGDSRTFWVEEKDGFGSWREINAVLRAASRYSSVWVAAENYDNKSIRIDDNKLTQAQAEKIAETFDLIYEYETPVFGYEYGGGVSPQDPGYGGVDKDPKIQILIYDINFDYDYSKNLTTLGYFAAKDMYAQTALDEYKMNSKSNQAELFYIDSFEFDRRPMLLYSTLIHEFQHMINFNEKFIKNGRITEVWYNEMLSLLAEDMIGPLIGIDASQDAHPINNLMPFFLGKYNAAGITEWHTDDFTSYANVYAFGAYLARNYGGAELIMEIAKNGKANIPSLSGALSKINPGIVFEQAIDRYGEALIYSGDHKPAGALSFDSTVVKKINGVDYTFERFNIWDKTRFQENTLTPHKGPVIWSLDWIFTIPSHALIVQSLDEWQHRTGTLDITLWQPSSPYIDMYIMIR
ncbi:MAG: hypothetical protein LBD55_05900 [Treponema sp.]|jgi:hypothetical protein|nr:hypothetical protein [Treponema sp.]